MLYGNEVLESRIRSLLGTAQEMTDSLENIFKLQNSFDKQVHNSERFPQSKSEQIDKICTAIIHEAVELQRLTNWKWWKQPKPLDEDAAREELIDILHFVISAAIKLDMTAESFYYEYERKMQINKQRQEQGY